MYCPTCGNSVLDELFKENAKYKCASCNMLLLRRDDFTGCVDPHSIPITDLGKAKRLRKNWES